MRNLATLDDGDLDRVNGGLWEDILQPTFQDPTTPDNLGQWSGFDFRSSFEGPTQGLTPDMFGTGFEGWDGGGGDF